MFKVLWRSLKDLFDEMLLLIMVNVIWCVMCLPLLALAIVAVIQGDTFFATLIAFLAVLPLGPANGGLYTIAQRVIEGRTSKIADFFAGVKATAKLGWKIYGLWMFVLVTLLFNMSFYASLSNTVGAFLLVLFLYLTAIWFAVLIYIGPLMIVQTDKSIKLIARNAALMTFGRPLFTLVTLILMTLIVGVSVGFTLVLLPALIMFSFLAVWSFRATTKLIEDADERRRLAEEKAATAVGGPRYSSDKGRGGQIKPRE
ncbi:MAG: hypothetical protein H7Z42_20290 [Roseiflexaceae bacterium]|nr:hypothetical protein [Roseiflexaceae bacterium]